MAQPTAPDDDAVDRGQVRGLVVDANDGIIAVAGIGEGFVGAGASPRAALLAVVAAAIAGSIALAGAKFVEAANERDAQRALIDEEARQLALSPEDELAELTAIYEAKGLPDDLAAQVAIELSRHNPLAAHVEAEHGIDVRSDIRPLLVAVRAALAFAAGASLIVVTVLVSPPRWRSLAVLVAAAGSLMVTSAIAGRWGRVPIWRTALRTATIGAIALLLSYLTGALIDL